MSTAVVMQLPEGSSNRGPALGSIEWLINAIKTLETWRRRQQSRREFTAIDARTLQDAGICPAMVFVEGNKTFWEGSECSTPLIMRPAP